MRSPASLILLLTRAGRTVAISTSSRSAPRRRWNGARPGLVVQALVAGGPLAGRWGALQDMRRALAPGWRLPAVVGAVVLTSATLSRQPVVYALELVLAGAAQLMQLATVALAVAAWPSHWREAFRSASSRVLGDAATDPPSAVSIDSRWSRRWWPRPWRCC
ncbi:MAG: hypothetical protein IPF47_25980 [Gemmatimonadetes bacterium]|nr:hypothetical protein [Gemmatimonadota bacterium]